MISLVRRRWPRSLAFAACLLVLGGGVNVYARFSGCVAVLANEAADESGGQFREEVFKVVNFLILAVGLAYLLRKPLGQFLASRSESVRKSLEEGRRAVEASQIQLTAIHEKLQRLEKEIAAFKDAAVREMEEESERRRQATAREVERILESVRVQMDVSLRAARLELKTYTAQQALQFAEGIIGQRLDDDGRHRLVGRFAESLTQAREPNA